MSPSAGPTPAVTAAARARLEFSVHRYEHDPDDDDYADEAAEALGVDPDRLFKTLVAMLDGRPVVAVVPASRRLDLKALATALGGKKAVMAHPGEAERATGYLVGGISPLGQKRVLPTVIDRSAERWGTIFVSAGQRGLELELPPGELLRAVGALGAPIAR